MFAFDHWADWLKIQADTLKGDSLTVAYRDTRDIPECASNPSFGLDVTSPERLGSIGFWKVGLCDYQIIDIATEEFVANESMLEANDETVAALFARFASFFEEQPS